MRSVRLPNPMIALVWTAFLLPDRLLGGRADFFLAVAAFLFACETLWVKPSPWETREPAGRAASIFATLQILSLFSYLFALAFKGAQTGPQDLLELPRWLLLGVFAVYLIRHHDASVSAATEKAAIAAVYLSWAAFETPGQLTYAVALSGLWLLLFSRSKLRLVHAGAAAAVLFAWGARPVRPVSGAVLSFITRSPLLGWGPARYDLAAAAAGQYQMWRVRGGALGSAAIAAGLAVLVYRLLRNEEDLRRRAAAGVFLAAAALLLRGGPWLDSYRLFFATAFLLAAIPRGTGRAV